MRPRTLTPEENTCGECCVCHLPIMKDDAVTFISKGDVISAHAHERCVTTENEEFAESIGLHLEFGRGWEIEHD